MFYIIYKITNKIDGKFYIGKHQTKNLDDGYMGSGILIRRAIRRHGLHNFKKEILHIFQTKEEMNEAERNLVVLSEDSYNLCPGGEGGFGYINQRGLNRKASREELLAQLCAARKKLADLRNDEEFMNEYRANLSAACKQRKPSFKNKKHSDATIQKMRRAKAGQSTGSKNSQFGTVWITNGTSNKKIKKDSVLEAGWVYGRSAR